MTSNGYQFKHFLKDKNIAHGISTKASGSIKNVESLQIDHERLAKFGRELGITEVIICMKQVHSGTVALIENAENLQIPETDVLITNKKNLPLAVLTADCLPILLYDPKKHVIGVAHAGYRGLLKHIIENTVQEFVSQYQSNPYDIIVGIGPSIETMCYEVGEEVIEQFQRVFPEFENMFSKQKDGYFLDLRSIAKQCLMKEGILPEHIEIMNVCTKCDPHFYSYRGGDTDGRFVSLISLV